MYVRKVEGNQMKLRKAISMFPFSTLPPRPIRVSSKSLEIYIQWRYTIVCNHTQRYKTVYSSRIIPNADHRHLSLNDSVRFYDFRMRKPFVAISLSIRFRYTEPIDEFHIYPFFSVKGRLRACMTDLGTY